MKEMFMTRSELLAALPWSRNVVGKMIRKGVFRPVRNPVGTNRSKMIFWRPQIEEAIASMIGAEVNLARGVCGK